MKESTRRTHSRRVAPKLVADAMHRGVFACRSGASAITAARIMAAHHVHSVLVIGEDGSCSRIVTAAGLAEGLEAGTIGAQTADEIAAAPVTVGPLEPLRRAVERMRDCHTTHLVVSQKSVGVLSALDLLDVVAEGEGL